ncbi:MAG: helicase Cas3 [bacterium ADurb.Bin429]|nr:MAG: helicase Cas3 [bacterium ADurb.Bin429]
MQCFESLFAARPAACQKVHRLAQSVLILDEVQALPPGLLTPIIDALRVLTERYGTTVVLCTATQPALTADSGLLSGFANVREIVSDPAAHFQTLRRVTYTLPAVPWSWETIAETMRDHPQCLTVLNTRADALALLETLDDPDALHLSTLLCPAHRRAVLEDIRARLRENRPCRVVSTQVVEAGVDVDFPCVLRASGPLDRLVQAAGRCNREGRLDAGEVIIFTPEEMRMPKGAYATAFAHAQQVLQCPDVDLYDPAIFPAYFRAVFGDVQTDAAGIQALRERLDFPAVAAAFRMIPDETVPVLVPFDEKREDIKALVGKVRGKGHLSRTDWREAQQYSVAVRRREFQQYQRDGLVDEILPDSGLFRWLGGYGARGLAEVAWDAADLIV